LIELALAPCNVYIAEHRYVAPAQLALREMAHSIECLHRSITPSACLYESIRDAVFVRADVDVDL
jgi:hypothetical protein